MFRRAALLPAGGQINSIAIGWITFDLEADG